MRKAAQKHHYHHGDLKLSLLSAAAAMIAEHGIEGLSLRKLADRVGVSRTAPYHHFKDKGELLCAIASRGFAQMQNQAETIFADDSISQRDRFRRFAHNYVQFARQNPELYELMLGRAIWQAQQSNEELKQSAYPCFKQQLDMVREWQRLGLLKLDENPLRLSQVVWGTLHGIAKLLIDGIYTDTGPAEAMLDCAIELFLLPEPQ